MLAADAIRQPVLVTGAFGFIGRRTIDALLELGVDQVHAFDLPGLVMPDTWQGKVTYVPGDMGYQPDVVRAMRGIGTVIHLAAMVGDWIPLSRHERVTLNGSNYLFKEAVKQKTRVVLSSSIVVYGDRLTDGPNPEDKPWGHYLGPYSQCKQAQERMAWEYYTRDDLLLAVVRPANVYGAGSKPWVHDVVATLKTRAPILIDGGDFNAALVHVDNVVQLLLRCASDDAALGQAFNGGDGNGITWQRYMSDLSHALALPPPKSVPKAVVKPLTTLTESIWTLMGLDNRPPITKEALNLVCGETIIPIQKAQKILNYQPQVSYEQGIAEVLGYLKRTLMT